MTDSRIMTMKVREWHSTLDADLPELSDHEAWEERYRTFGALLYMDIEAPKEEFPSGADTIERYAEKYLGTFKDLVAAGTTFRVELGWAKLCYYIGLTERFATTPADPFMDNSHFLYAWEWSFKLASDLGPHPRSGENTISLERLEALILGAKCLEQLLSTKDEHPQNRIVTCWLDEMNGLVARTREMADLTSQDKYIVSRFNDQLSQLAAVWDYVVMQSLGPR